MILVTFSSFSIKSAMPYEPKEPAAPFLWRGGEGDRKHLLEFILENTANEGINHALLCLKSISASLLLHCSRKYSMLLCFGFIPHISLQIKSAPPPRPTIVHKNCETAVLSHFNVMPIYRLMHGTERISTKSSKTIRQPSHSKN